MKISNNWLKDYIKTDLTTEKIGAYLTDIGLEVEGITPYENIKGSLEGIIVGKVLTCEKHPNADKLSKTTINIGNGTILNIVCGAPNVAIGQTVAVATVGTTLYDKTGNPFTISKTKIRGEISEGMLCAEDEIGLGQGHNGIIILDENYEIGKPLADYYHIEKDSVYEIGLTPNRTDAISHYGVARDLHAFLSCNSISSEFNKIENTNITSEGTHNFSTFKGHNTTVQDPVKTMYAVKVFQEGTTVRIHVLGDGFVYHMVRNIAGFLVDVGLGRFQPEDVPRIIAGENRQLIGKTAPAHGLCLDTVFTDEASLQERVRSIANL